MQLRHQYPSRVSDSDALESLPEVCPNEYDIPTHAAALPQIRKPIPHGLTLELHNRVYCVDCGMELAITQ